MLHDSSRFSSVIALNSHGFYIIAVMIEIKFLQLTTTLTAKLAGYETIPEFKEAAVCDGLYPTVTLDRKVKKRRSSGSPSSMTSRERKIRAAATSSTSTSNTLLREEVEKESVTGRCPFTPVVTVRTGRTRDGSASCVIPLLHRKCHCDNKRYLWAVIFSTH